MAQTFTEFYADAASGSNVNGGSNAGAATMSDTAGTGSYNAATNIYTSVATNGSVAVGQFIAIYSGAATEAAGIARITAVSGGGGIPWVITCDLFQSGTEPTTASTYKANVGGAWKGPNGAVDFPFDYLAATSTNAAGDPPRVNFKSGTTYSITAAMAANKTGPLVYEGYTTTIGDGGRAIFDGGTSGASYALLSASGTGVMLRSLMFRNNGATGSANGVTNTSQVIWQRCVVHSVRGNGFAIAGIGTAIECEAYSCNQSNTVDLAGFKVTTTIARIIRCIAHDNTGSNTDGFHDVAGGTYIDCIADTNGKDGFYVGSSSDHGVLLNCVAYLNSGDGIDHDGVNDLLLLENCLLYNNGGFGVNNNTTNYITQAVNCAYFNNTSGESTGIEDETGAVTLTGDPFVAASTGNFSLNDTAGAGAACRAAGRGTFTETQASYSGTASTPDIGAAQHADPAGGGGLLVHPGFSGRING